MQASTVHGSPRRRLATAPRLLIWLTALAACLALTAPGRAQAPVAVSTTPSGPAWSELTPAQRAALKPLQTQWAGIEDTRKRKWLDIAARFPRMAPEQQQRLRDRMAEWAAMTPAQRNAARLQFETARLVPSDERQARWDAYQALPEEQRQALVEQAARRAPTARTVPRPDPTRPEPKSNIVQPTAGGALPRPVAPATVQANVGASTRPINQRPTPPRHQQPGLPKIAASPGFVDSATLLPQRGPQGAAADAPRAAP
jgi:Protein of unknown function (DUF3106)